MPKGGQFPVQHRANPGRWRIVARSRTGCGRGDRGKDEVVEPKVAVHQATFLVRGDVVWQPGDKLVHRGDRLGLGTEILACPTVDLTGKVVARLAEVGQPHLRRVDPVKLGNGLVHCEVDRAPLRRRHSAQTLIPVHLPLHKLHHIKRATDHRLVLAQPEHPGHRTFEPASAASTRYSRSMACAEGSSFATGPGLERMT